MANGRDARLIKRIRNEILVAMKMVYPAAMQSQQVFRSLLALFPDLDFDTFKRDLHYLLDKGYLVRVVADREPAPSLTPWRKRWLRLTSGGIEVADRCVTDPALDES